jgi:hypothetical protein
LLCDVRVFDQVKAKSVNVKLDCLVVILHY